MRQWVKRIAVLVVLAGLAGGGAAWYLRHENGQVALFRTEQVTRGRLVVSISATGTVEPEEVVDVGAQVAGKINAFGKDGNGKTIDYGSVVEEGTVLAQIDDSLYAADLAQAEAQLRVSQAGVARARADLQQLKAKLEQARVDVQQYSARQEQAVANLLQATVKLEQAQRNWERVRKVDPASGAMSQESYEAYKSVFEEAQANVASSEAAVLQAKASLASSQAAVPQAEASIASGEAAIAQAEGNVAGAQVAVERARRNLGYCTIKSPVKGVIIDRRVNIGQTVVASLNAPSLFLVAKDLNRMQVWVAVNEADVGKIKPGQPVGFTVDAFPDEMFRGEVGKVRLNASMTQNVVTYTVEITTDNSKGRLLPYLTANVRFEIQRVDDVLLAPSAALRWSPSAEHVAAEYRDEAEASSREPSRRPSDAPAASGPSDVTRKPPVRGVIWALQGQQVRPILVAVGLSDGVLTEVRGEGVKEGQEIVTGLETSSAGPSGSANPFTPKMPKPPPKAGGGPPL